MSQFICYDISNDTTREKLSAQLIAFGFYRLQRSVFAGNPTETLLKEITKWIHQFQQNSLDAGDNVLLLSCTAHQLKTMLVFGTEPPDLGMLRSPPGTLII